jgi:UDP-xylose:glucoside alpha-1,3-xylosyltransferase
MYGSNCKSAEVNGISILHGNRANFHSNKRPFFKAVYKTFNKYHHGDDTGTAIKNLRKELGNFDKTYCGALKSALLKHPLKFINV